MNKKRISIKFLCFMLTFVFLIAIVMSPLFSVIAEVAVDADTLEDSDVENTASFSTDTIYQIVTDRFYDGDTSNNPTSDLYDTNNNRKYHGGDWAGIIEKIEDGYLTGLGISAIWISSPVEQIASIDPSNETAAYHGYWAKDFFRTNEYFGSFEDFSELIEVAHANDIKVVIDFAPNHTSTAEYGEYVFPEDGALYRDGVLVGSFSDDTDGIFNHESWTDYSTWENSIYHSMYGLADLNQMNSTVDEYLKDAVDMWLDLGVDGLRVDAVKHMPMGWQTNWLSDIYEEHNVFVFGEWYTGSTDSDSEMDGFANESGMSLLDFRFANAVRSAIGTPLSEGALSMQDLYNVIVATEEQYKEINDQVTFIDNHDMSRFMTLSNNTQHAVDTAYVLLMTASGVPTIYYGSEQYATGESDPDNRGDMPSFSTTSTAYQIISELAPLRKENPAVAYGTSSQIWTNDQVLVYERTFGDSVVVIAVNRNTSQGYSLSGLYSSLPEGTYEDVLNGIMGGESINVTSSGAITNEDGGTLYLGAGECMVFSYVAEDDGDDGAPLIGNIDPLIGITGNTITITGRRFGEYDSDCSVTFGDTEAEIISWSNSCIRLVIPNVSPGYYDISVNTGQGSGYYSSGGISRQFKVLTASQVAVRFIVKDAYTSYGENIYIVGNCIELGNWDTDKAIGPFFNSTETIASYPDWFFDISVPAGTVIEFKFIKKDSLGNVIWESGSNHVYTTPVNSTATVTYYFVN